MKVSWCPSMALKQDRARDLPNLSDTFPPPGSRERVDAIAATFLASQKNRQRFIIARVFFSGWLHAMRCSGHVILIKIDAWLKLLGALALSKSGVSFVYAKIYILSMDLSVAFPEFPSAFQWLKVFKPAQRCNLKLKRAQDWSIYLLSHLVGEWSLFLVLL